MEVITIQNEAMQTLLKSNAELTQKFGELIERLETALSGFAPSNQIANPLEWADTDQTCKMLNISPRTLQKYRDDSVLPFSTIGGKKYFKIADIKHILEENYTAI
ncbi:helix-turn-helix domain-containing protein [Culturomica massiliensis]|jgi:hypothetical protein|uniref:helix-turn-helix domain-containing protein n=1 Tax=Culturomica massiliensis TaxID=1841857 RepID=UPI001D0C03BE|nr:MULTISPECIES: helix-turn-helix domain-containing protein [Odoribacteraceae]